MSKLPEQYQFIDLSDYGRFIARKIAKALRPTAVTPIHVTIWFIIAGFLAILFILLEMNFLAALCLVLKSVLDAADGELARLKETPSYVGRYFDSIADIVLNFLFLMTFWYISDNSLFFMFLAFISIQLQGTLYNYYYVILRNSVSGDKTSRVFEDSIPVAFKEESQSKVNLYYRIYNTLYITFDKTIYYLDSGAINSKPFSKWFMTLLSMLGLGFQLLIMSIMLLLNLEQYIISFFIAYSILIPTFIFIRRFILHI